METRPELDVVVEREARERERQRAMELDAAVKRERKRAREIGSHERRLHFWVAWEPRRRMGTRIGPELMMVLDYCSSVLGPILRFRVSVGESLMTFVG
jgi:hypothetical protein